MRLENPHALHPTLPLSPFLLDADHFRQSVRRRWDILQLRVLNQHAELGRGTQPGKPGWRRSYACSASCRRCAAQYRATSLRSSTAMRSSMRHLLVCLRANMRQHLNIRW